MVTRIGSPDPDSLDGSPDDDILLGKGGNDTLTGFEGADTLKGGAGNDSLYAGPGSDRLYGGTDDDRLHFTELSGGRAFGGSGVDILDLSLAVGPTLFLDFAKGTASQSGIIPGTLEFLGMESLFLTSFGDGDTVIGGAGNDTMIFGGRGAEAHGGGGDDLIGYTPDVAALLDGGEGDDTLQVDTGDNVLYFIVDSSDGSVDDGQLSTLTGFENFYVTGGTFADIAAFVQGNDTFSGNEGDDTVFGGAGDDSLYGGKGSDSITGGDGNDRLGGGRGLDVVFGGDGDDRIILFLGDDTVTGGSGADKFVFSHNQSSFHTITDFDGSEDQLWYKSTLLQFGPAPGRLDPTLLSYGNATGTNAQFVLTYDADTDESRLIWDPNGANPAGGVYGVGLFLGHITLEASNILIL